MWVLFVIDYIVNTHARDDFKYVRMSMTELECIDGLWKEFTQGETVACVWEV